MGEVIAAGIALMFVFEGMLPFVAPRLWRETFRKAMELTDGQLRFFGLITTSRRHKLWNCAPRRSVKEHRDARSTSHGTAAARAWQGDPLGIGTDRRRQDV